MTYLLSLGTVVTKSFYVLLLTDSFITVASLLVTVSFFGGRYISQLASSDLFPNNLRVLDFDTVH